MVTLTGALSDAGVRLLWREVTTAGYACGVAGFDRGGEAR